MGNALAKKLEIIQSMTNHEVAVGENRLVASDWDFISKVH
jgi:hypothetical protein